MDYTFIFDDTKDTIENILDFIYADFIEKQLQYQLGILQNE